MGLRFGETSYPGGGSSTTAKTIADAINDDPVASTLVTATAQPGTTMVLQVPTSGWVQLAGGENSDGASDMYDGPRAVEAAALHLLEGGKLVTRAYKASSIDSATGNPKPGMVAPKWMKKDKTEAIATFSPEIAYSNPGFNWNASATDVTNTLAAGVSTVFYAGHGSIGSWAGPNLTTAEASTVSNKPGVFPVVFSHACLTGSYVGNDSLAEALLQNAFGGASAVFAATRKTSGSLEPWINGFFDSVDDSFDATISKAGLDLHRIGTRVTYMRDFYVAKNGADEQTHDQLHKFVLFGDPSMRYRPFE